MQALHHPNIARVVWAGRLSSGEWYLLNELIEGRLLREYTRPESLLPLDDVVRLGCELLDALCALHPDQNRIEELRTRGDLSQEEYDELQDLLASGYVHRDIKPENILVRETGQLVLIDFGIASRVGAEVVTQSHTPGYTPPDADLTRWSTDYDLYAAGAVLFELACGQRPRSASGGPDAIDHDRPELPAGIHSFVRRACAPTRDQRFRSAVEMRDELRSIAAALRSVRDEQTPAEASPGSPAAAEVLELPPYTTWPPRPLPGAGGTPAETIIEALLEIVRYEGPIVCERLYEIYVAASGDPGVPSVKRILNRATHAAVRDDRLVQIEPPGGGQMDKTVHLPLEEPVVLRDRGPRRISHIPATEVRALASIFDDDPDRRHPESAYSTLLAVRIWFDADDADWWELSYLARCIGIDEPDPSMIDPL